MRSTLALSSLTHSLHPMASTSSLLPLLQSLPHLRSRFPLLSPHRRLAACLSTLEASQSSRDATAAALYATAKPPSPPPARPDSPAKSWADHPDYRRWRDKEEEILKDIEPITLLTKEILHSERYMDGERLCPDDEKEVVKKLLTYHPHSEDKIGRGLDYIMSSWKQSSFYSQSLIFEKLKKKDPLQVDRHPAYRNSRCLFVVRTDGGWIDFSYQKCLRAYIREKYPSHAQRFIREHFKRS